MECLFGWGFYFPKLVHFGLAVFVCWYLMYHVMYFSFLIIKGFRTIVFIFHCYFHNVSVDMSSGLLQLFGELRNLHGTSNYALYWTTGVACSDSVSHNRVQVLSIPVLLLACSEDWTCNLQIIVSLEAEGTNAYNRCAMCPAGEFRVNFFELST